MVLILAILGSILGSFAGAQVWRLRALQLTAEKKAGEPVDSSELRRLRPITAKGVKEDRSHCLSCGHVLHWYDLLPVVSWVSTGGRCRYCRAFIGWMEPAAEVGLAAFFVVSYLVWPVPLDGPLSIAQFVSWLLAGLGLAVLFFYDLRWSLLPNLVMFPLIAVAALYAGLGLLQLDAATMLTGAISVVGSVAILSGLYLAIYVVSQGRWIGFGDVKLGIVLGLLLMQWPLALLALFAANVIGTLVVLPGMLSGKITRQSRVPFGPFLIAGFLIAAWWGQAIVAWYAGGIFVF